MTSDDPKARGFGERLAQLQLSPTSGRKHDEKFKKKAYQLSQELEDASSRGEISEDDYLHAMSDLGVQFALRSPDQRILQQRSQRGSLDLQSMIETTATRDNIQLTQILPAIVFGTHQVFP